MSAPRPGSAAGGVEPPSAPADLLAAAIACCQVILAWTEVGPGGLGFRVERTNGNDRGSNFAGIGSVGMHVTAYRDGTVTPRTAYAYRVRAWNTAGHSPPSLAVEITTPQDGPERASDED